MEEAKPIIVEGGMKYEIGDFDINELKLWEDNPRTISKEELERLKKSIKRKPYFMSARPIVLSDRTGEKVIIAGNQRYKAVKELGWAEVPCILFHCETEEQEVEIAMVDNHNNGEWDVEKLSEKFMDYPLEDWLGSDWEKLAGEFGKETKEVKEDEVPEVDDKPTKTKLGDIYQLGKHRLMCGDSTKTEDVGKLLGGDNIELVLTDPPCNMSETGGGFLASSHKNIKERIKSLVDFNPYSIQWLSEQNIISVSNIMIFTSKNLIRNYLEIFKDWKYNILFWGKTNPSPFVNNNHLPDVEYLLYFYKNGRIFNNGLKPASIYSRYYISDKTEGRKNAGGDLHPTIKPIEFLGREIKILSTEGGAVLDLFGGSGTTLIAAEQLDRKAYVMELDPKYCDVIIERWEKFTGEKAKRINE